MAWLWPSAARHIAQRRDALIRYVDNCLKYSLIVRRVSQHLLYRDSSGERRTSRRACSNSRSNFYTTARASALWIAGKKKRKKKQGKREERNTYARGGDTFYTRETRDRDRDRDRW